MVAWQSGLMKIYFKDTQNHVPHLITNHFQLIQNLSALPWKYGVSDSKPKKKLNNKKPKTKKEKRKKKKKVIDIYFFTCT